MLEGVFSILFLGRRLYIYPAGLDWVCSFFLMFLCEKARYIRQGKGGRTAGTGGIIGFGLNTGDRMGFGDLAGWIRYHVASKKTTLK